MFSKVFSDRPNRMTMHGESVMAGVRVNQVHKQRGDVSVGAREQLHASSAGSDCTDEGLRNDVNVGIQYISSWLRGNGAAAIFNMMEDAATAEISRSQVWQWVRHGVVLDTGAEVTRELVRRYETEELEKIREQVGDDFFYSEGRPDQSRELFERVALSDEFEPFLTLSAYEVLED